VLTGPGKGAGATTATLVGDTSATLDADAGTTDTTAATASAVTATGTATGTAAGPTSHRRPWMSLLAAGLVYLVIGFALWIHAWVSGATTHTLCGCGDPALFLWFFQWPATALAHGQNPFFSTALFHPQGVNLLAQTSVTGLSIPLVPVTWIWGPVAALNVASTIAPALTAFTAFWALRRWVDWTPAAFVGGLLYGFSPFVLTSLQFAHLMTAALMLLPLLLVTLDEILLRQRHSPLWTGVALALLAFGQFFLSTELLAIVAITAAVCIVVLVVAAALFRRDELRRLAPHAAKALAIGAGLSVVLLAWPVWFALAGPAHLSGLVWPAVPVIGGFIPSSFVSPSYPTQDNVPFLVLGGYTGAQLASAAYVGWSFIAVLVAGTAAFFRDRRLWFFGFVVVFCFYCSLGARTGQTWVPAQVFIRLPVVENVIQQRFMAVGFLAGAVMLAIILDRTYAVVRGSSAARARAGGWPWVATRGLAALAALAVACLALVPMGVTFGSRLPFVMRPVILPPWYRTVAPALPPGQVLLSYPAPFSGIQSSMAWQAVNAMHYSQAGGGGPQGVASRAGTAAPGFVVLTNLAFGLGVPQPTGTRAELAAVRHALAQWQVTMVVVATNPAAPGIQQGHDPLYAASFMTAALGRLPRLEAGAWVWDHVQAGLAARQPLVVGHGTIARCVARAEGPSGRVAATLRAPTCVGLAGLRSLLR
jgi:hypothetical protein